ncbi:biopolymer transporter ExbD [candidate division KSB1 bacterium]|nr:biopolymer transporter ExbD [candidate division KSB1 bacterium]
MMLEKERKSGAEIPTASMADIAFLLLIFFLVVTTIDVDKGLGLTLPPIGQNIEIQKKNICTVLINAGGKVLIDEKPVQINLIHEIISLKLANNKLLIVSLKTARETKYEVYIKTLDQIKMAGAKRISLAEPDV